MVGIGIAAQGERLSGLDASLWGVTWIDPCDQQALVIDGADGLKTLWSLMSLVRLIAIDEV